MEIDGRRGDLWVMSAGLANGAAALHKIQLVSGRPLKSFPIAADPDAITPVDLAVTPAGVVVALDSAGHQLLVLRSKGTAVERVMRIDAAEPASLAAAGEEGIVYVASRDGVSRVDLRARTATKVARSEIGLARSSRADPVAPAGTDRDSRRCRWHAPHRPSHPQRQRTRGHEGHEDRQPGPPALAARRSSPFPGTSLSIWSTARRRTSTSSGCRCREAPWFDAFRRE